MAFDGLIGYAEIAPIGRPGLEPKARYMEIRPEIAAAHDELTAWRRDLHAHPETAFEEVRTADFVAERLEGFGIAVHRGLAKTGVVGTLRAGNSDRRIGLRADMDALDIVEENDVSWKSRHRGKMHACGHDGHTAMLLGAAQYLARTRDFDGTIHFIFQPAEENLAGGKVMVDEGLFDQFPVDCVFGMHNRPGIPVGEVAVLYGPVMAAADFFTIEVRGDGSHAAFPHHGVDPLVTAAEIVVSLQRIVSRTVDPMESAVVSVTQIHGGTTMNVIPEFATITGTVRSFKPEIQDRIEARIQDVVSGVCAAHGLEHNLQYDRRYAPTTNTDPETDMAAAACAKVVGQAAVRRDVPPSMGAEDFGWMLLARPGAYILIGNGEGEAGGCVVHNPRYDFNDRILPIGASYWATLAEDYLTS